MLDDLSKWTIALPAKGCGELDTTTHTAVLHKCTLATNSGYFQFQAKPTFCLGEIVIGGAIVQWDNDGAPLVAVSSTARKSYVGPLNKTDIADLDISYAVSGFGVIVLDGKVHPEGINRARSAITSLRPTAEEIAPRTVAALDAQGRMLLAAIDGVEALGLGLTLSELAEVFADGAPGFPFQALHAVNMDGGGSTTLSASPDWPTQPAQVFNRPTDTDVGPVVERPVTAIACVLG